MHVRLTVLVMIRPSVSDNVEIRSRSVTQNPGVLSALGRENKLLLGGGLLISPMQPHSGLVKSWRIIMRYAGRDLVGRLNIGIFSVCIILLPDGFWDRLS